MERGNGRETKLLLETYLEFQKSGILKQQLIRLIPIISL